MRVLGIDPGFDRMGWGVVEENHSKIVPVNYSFLHTDKSLPAQKRLSDLFDGVTNLIKEYHPEVLAMEDLFFNTNAKTVILVGQARGVIMLAAEKQQVEVFSYPPLAIKMSVVGFGRAEKEQVQKMVVNILHLKEIPKPDDTADALAVALCHLFVYKFKARTTKI